MVILCSEQFGGSSYCLNVAKFRDTAPLTPRKVGASCSHLACEQALLFKRASRRARGFAACSRVLARLASLDQIRELARRLVLISAIYSQSLVNYIPVFFLSLGSLSNDDGDGNENGKKVIGLDSETTTLHVHHSFLYISLPSLHDYNVKVPNFTFC